MALLKKPILDVRNLSVGFRTESGVVSAVRDFNMNVEQGEVMGLVGESGSGKSVTSKTIMRLMPGNAVIDPASRVTLHHDGADHDVLKLKGRGLKMVHGGVVSMIFQEPMASFAPAIRLGDQIVETIRIHRGLSREEARKIGIELFDRVGIPMPDVRFDQYVFELSGGMRQRAMIAMALSTQPKLLIADEPTTALDVTIQAQVLDLLLELREQMGMSMVFITHDLGVIGKIADRVTVLKKGEVVEAGFADDVLYDPRHAYTRELIEALPHLDELPPPPAETPEPLLEVRGINIEFPMNTGGRRDQSVFHAVKNANLTLPKGRIIGLVGESGSGKTTLGKCILGATPIASGEVEFFTDPPVKFTHPRQIKRRKFAQMAQMIFQDPHASLNPRLTVRDIIAEPLIATGLVKDKKEIDARVKRVAERCKIDITHLRRFPHAFSGGQRQRICIARALISEPKFIVADESVAALDVSTQSEILKLLKELRDDLGITFLFISHDLSVIANLCDRVVVIKHGDLVEEGTVQEIFLNPQQEYTKKLIGAIPLLERRGGPGGHETPTIMEPAE
ncbi:MAG: ABC transporter ATP-binding protein [Rhodobacterales bacterium]|nr:MAG: ABC transporter ATP-binding protein [Rhodobacterales bacterium]